MARFKILIGELAFVYLVTFHAVIADFCQRGKEEICGNWFCQPVPGLQYSNVGSSGNYSRTTAMNSDGSCESAPSSFSGPLAPLNEELSLHFRGPLQLKQLAVYVPSGVAPIANRKRAETVDNQDVKQVHGAHGHRHGDIHNRAVKGNEQKIARQEVVATIDGVVQSWGNNYFGPSSGTPLVEVTATIDGQVVSWKNDWSGDTQTFTPAAEAAPARITFSPAVLSVEAQSSSISTAVSSSSQPHPTTDNSNTYERIAYYDSASQNADNLVFLGNYGGQGSGVWDTNFGSSLSYINCEGNGGASSPQILADTTIPSDKEVVVMLGIECDETSCGYVRPGSVAYHGFDGADKVFLFEFSMPQSDDAGFEADMPAIWMLNAHIPRTLQYGQADCSCWESGCGEFDIVETLCSSEASTYLKSTLHTNKPGGNSDYIVRPTLTTMKLAVVFSSESSKLYIQTLPDNHNFSPSLAASDIELICNISGNKISTFAIT